MKKVNPGFLLPHIGIILGIVLAIAVTLAFQDNTLGVCIAVGISSMFITVPIAFALVIPGIGKSKRKKTLEQGTMANGMREFETFNSSNCIVRIDSMGRVAIVCTYNPNEFQLFSVHQLTNIKTSYFKGPLGGASAVYFEFVVNGTRIKVPTFQSNQAYRMDSNYIIEGTSKADYYCELIYRLQRGY